MGKPLLKDMLNMDVGRINNTAGAHVRIYKGETPNRIAHAVALEYINNGLIQTKAYRTVRGCAAGTAKRNAHLLFKKPEMQEAISAYLAGEKKAAGEMPPDRSWALRTWKGWVEINILDYFGPNWELMSKEEMEEKLTVEQQRGITQLEVVTHTRTGTDGEQHVTKTVKFKVMDKGKALDSYARSEKWLANHEIHVQLQIGADALIDAATRRQERLAVDDIDGEAEVTHVEKNDVS